MEGKQRGIEGGRGHQEGGQGGHAWHTLMDGDAGGRSSGNDDEDNLDDNYGDASRFLLKLLFPKFSSQHRGGVN